MDDMDRQQDIQNRERENRLKNASQPKVRMVQQRKIHKTVFCPRVKKLIPCHQCDGCDKYTGKSHEDGQDWIDCLVVNQDKRAVQKLIK